VGIVLFVLLGTVRPTIIALTAIPVSIFLTGVIFRHFGLSINTMTLGGLAIAIGGLVDDAVVDVENIMRRLREDRTRGTAQRQPLIQLVARASMEVRSAILYATLIIALSYDVLSITFVIAPEATVYV